MGRIALFLSSLVFASAAVAASEATVRLGGDVDITEAVDGSLHVLAGRINVEAPVGGDASLAGGSIKVTGPVTGDIHAAGGRVLLNGPVAGSVSVAAGTLELGPDTRINGTLSFRGGELKRDAAAVVTGAIEQTTGHAHRHFEQHHDAVWRYTHGWVWSIGLIVLAALIAAALPGPSLRMAQELRERPWLTTLVGLVALTTIPVAAVLLMITIIGIPIALLAIAAYAALLLVGYVWLAVVVSGMLLDRVKPETAALTAGRAGAAVLAMFTLALLARLPYAGGFIVFAALVVGVGMVVATMTRRMKPAQAGQPA
jgi:cytoskeletal protein CcmA (bactofilin family)